MEKGVSAQNVLMMERWFPIETERLLLREYTVADFHWFRIRTDAGHYGTRTVASAGIGQ